MKILIVTGIFPPDLGGPSSYVPFIANELISAGHDIVNVVTLSNDKNIKNKFAFPVTRIKRRLFFFLRFILTIKTIIFHARKCDLIFVNGLVLESVFACKFLFRKPMVVKVVGDLIWEKGRNSNAFNINLDEFQNYKLGIYWNFLRGLQKFYMRRADQVIVPSLYLRNIVKTWGVKNSNIKVIYNSVNFKIFNSKSTDKNHKFKYDLITVARLVPWKGIKELIDISKKINASLLVVGNGPLKDYLQNYSRMINANTVFVGSKTQKEVASYFRTSKVFVLNSSYEGLPHIILEAKLSKIPTIATSAGGTNETINNGIDGILVPVGDNNKLELAINNLLNNEAKRKKIIDKGYEHVIKYFNSQTQVSETFAVLQKTYDKQNENT